MSVLVDGARDRAEVLVDGDGVEERGRLQTVEEHVEERRRGLPARRRPHHRAAFDARAVEVELREIGEEMDGGEHLIARFGEVGDEAVVHERRALHGHAFDLERRGPSEGERQGGRREQVLAQDQLVHAEVAETGEGEAVQGLVGDPGASVRVAPAPRSAARASLPLRSCVVTSSASPSCSIAAASMSTYGPATTWRAPIAVRSCSRSCRSSVDAVASSAVSVSADGTIVRGTSGWRAERADEGRERRAVLVRQPRGTVWRERGCGRQRNDGRHGERTRSRRIGGAAHEVGREAVDEVAVGCPELDAQWVDAVDTDPGAAGLVARADRRGDHDVAASVACAAHRSVARRWPAASRDLPRATPGTASESGASDRCTTAISLPAGAS